MRHCPSPVPNLTEFIFSCLAPTARPQPMDSANGVFATGLSSLPNEIYNQILLDAFDPPVDYMASLPTYLLPQKVWRGFFLDKSLVRWLWVLNYTPFLQDEVVNRDWEVFCRELTQVDIFEPGHPLEHAPLELRNRRRIWSSVEDARYGDCYFCDRWPGPFACKRPPCRINHWDDQIATKGK